MAPRNRKPDTPLSEDPRFQNIVAQAHAAGFGGHAPATAVEEPTLKAVPAPAAPHSLQSDPASYEGMTRVEKLFKAIELGDAATIRDTVKAKYVRNKDGTDSKALIQDELSVVPGNPSEKQHFPEPLLHRAIRSEQMASVLEIVNLGFEQTKSDKAAQEKLFNATRDIDGATVLHDLAASIPAKQKVGFTAADHGKWSPDALIPLFIASGTDVLAKSGGKSAADSAPNASVKEYLQTEMGKVLADDEQHAMRWQARHARELAAEGDHLKRIR